MQRPALVLALVLSSACGSDPPPADAGPTIDAGAQLDAATIADAGSVTLSSACGRGPFARDAVTPKSCEENPAPQCPTAPAEGAIPVAVFATCAYGEGESGCEPVNGGLCPEVGGAVLDFNLVNPNQEEPFGCWGRAHLLVEPSATGGLRVEYAGNPTNNADCSELPGFEGELQIENMCCEQIIDLHFPHGAFTFRVAIRVDWTTP